MIEAIRGIIAYQIVIFSSGIGTGTVGVVLFDCMAAYAAVTVLAQRKPAKQEIWLLPIGCLLAVSLCLEIMQGGR